MPNRDLPPFRDLRDFLDHLEAKGQLVRILEPVSVMHEITEIHRRVLRECGPALLFERAVQPDGRPAEMPVLVNLFGTTERVAWGLGVNRDGLRGLGESLAEMREPRPPQDLADAWSKLPIVRAALAMRPKDVRATGRTVLRGSSVDLARLPVQICWPGEPAPLITWRLPDAGARAR
jgi:4-hydroxy-3-polyprenylbenzoate decarboxylase